MSEMSKYALWIFEQYLAHEMSSEDFAQNFGGVYIHARRHPSDSLLNNVANAVIGPYSEFSGGHISEDIFRSALQEAILPFVPSSDLATIGLKA